MYIRLKTGEIYHTEHIKYTGDGYIQFKVSDSGYLLNMPIESLWDIQKNNPNA